MIHVYLIKLFLGYEFENIYIHVENYPVVELLVSGFQLIFGAFLPFALILCCNVIIIITVKLASKKRLRMELRVQGCGQRKRKGTEHLTRMLIFVSMAYVVTTLPHRFYHVVMNIPEVAYDLNNEYWFLRFSVENEVLFLVWCCNYACNFYLYCVGGGQRYRKDTVEILTTIICLRAKGTDGSF
jgi:hypothetical protein